MYLSHCLHELLQFYRPQLRLGQSEVALCLWARPYVCVCARACVCVGFLGFFNAFPQRWLPKLKRSVNMGREATSTYSTKGWGARFGGHPPLCQLALGWPCAPVPLPSGLCSDGTAAVRGWAADPRCINQKALLARVFRWTLSLFTQNALEDYLLLIGCVSGARMVPFCVVVHP